jgi:mRNA interferase MazF
MTRGDIVYVHNEHGHSVGSEWTYDRPAIIVSNNMCNKYSSVVELVYVTTSKRKRLLPTHVLVKSTPYPSTALCESIYSVDKSRIQRTIGHCSPQEMFRINDALAISLGLKGGGQNGL